MAGNCEWWTGMNIKKKKGSDSGVFYVTPTIPEFGAGRRKP